MHFLSMTEFVYNNSKHILIDKWVFQTVYTCDLRMNFQNLIIKQFKINTLMIKRDERLKNIKKYIHK